MNLEAIDKAFAEMIAAKGVETTLEVDRNYVYQLRNKLKNDVGISMETKLSLLKKSGWQEEAVAYTHHDLLSLARFILKTSAKAREFGAEYLVEKWALKK